jgi:hypothetical protein
VTVQFRGHLFVLSRGGLSIAHRPLWRCPERMLCVF